MKTSSFTSGLASSLLVALGVPPTIAWGVAFYSGQACNEDSEFSDVMYYGTGKNGKTPCMSWGDGAEGVTCYNVSFILVHLHCSYMLTSQVRGERIG